MEKKDRIIFIVEDSDIISNLLEKVINNTEGYFAKVFATGESMLDELEKKKPSGILLDYYLDPDKKGYMNGEEVLQKLQIMDVKIPVLMLTGIQDTVKIEELQYPNLVEVLNKDSHDIFEKVVHAIKSAF